MGEKEKVTTMVLKVNPQCHKCYKKVKNVLCKFPEIRDQKYDEKQNQVVIKVVCCSPEKIRDKICCKGGCAIISIEILPPPSPPPPSPPPPPIININIEIPPPPPPPPPPLVLFVPWYPPPCHCGCGRVWYPPPCHCGCGRGYCVTRPDYFSEENP